MSNPDAYLLEGELSIVEAARQHAVLLGLAESAGPQLELDLSAIAGCDSAGVQLLLSLRHSLAARGSALQLSGVPDAVRQALATYGLDEHLAPLAGARSGEIA